MHRLVVIAGSVLVGILLLLLLVFCSSEPQVEVLYGADDAEYAFVIDSTRYFDLNFEIFGMSMSIPMDERTVLLPSGDISRERRKEPSSEVARADKRLEELVKKRFDATLVEALEGAKTVAVRSYEDGTVLIKGIGAADGVYDSYMVFRCSEDGELVYCEINREDRKSGVTAISRFGDSLLLYGEILLDWELQPIEKTDLKVRESLSQEDVERSLEQAKVFSGDVTVKVREVVACRGGGDMSYVGFYFDGEQAFFVAEIASDGELVRLIRVDHIRGNVNGFNVKEAREGTLFDIIH